MLELRQKPDPVLRKKSEPIKDFSNLDLFLIPQMKEAMKCENGIGISAIQIGSPKQIFLMDEGNLEPTVVCNPKIISKSDDMEDMIEGCLSVEGMLISIKRPKTIEVEYYNEKGEIQNRILKRMNARVFQHEFDHLQGVLMEDLVICDVQVIDLLKEKSNDYEITVTINDGVEKDPLLFNMFVGKKIAEYKVDNADNTYKFPIEVLKRSLDSGMIEKVELGETNAISVSED